MTDKNLTNKACAMSGVVDNVVRTSRSSLDLHTNELSDAKLSIETSYLYT